MKNVTVVIATTFALVSTAMAVEIARRHATGDAAGFDAQAKPAASIALVRPDAADEPQTSVESPAKDGTSFKLAPGAATDAASAPAEPETAPMRDAARLPAMPLAEPDPAAAGLKGNAQAELPRAKSDADLFAGHPAPGGREDVGAAPPVAAVKPVIVNPPAKSSSRPEKRKSTTETAAAAPGEQAETKPAKSEERPEVKPEAKSDARPPRPAAAPEARPVDRVRRVASAPERETSESRPHAERHMPRVAHYARYQGGEVSARDPGAYGFSGVFGGCAYRGVVSATGYRILSSC